MLRRESKVFLVILVLFLNLANGEKLNFQESNRKNSILVFSEKKYLTNTTYLNLRKTVETISSYRFGLHTEPVISLKIGLSKYDQSHSNFSVLTDHKCNFLKSSSTYMQQDFRFFLNLYRDNLFIQSIDLSEYKYLEHDLFKEYFLMFDYSDLSNILLEIEVYSQYKADNNLFFCITASIPDPGLWGTYFYRKIGKIGLINTKISPKANFTKIFNR